MSDVIFPRLDQGMESGYLVKWLVDPGDDVVEGQPLFVIETEKVETEIEAPTAGTVREIRVPEGQEVAVGTVVAVIIEQAAYGGE